MIDALEMENVPLRREPDSTHVMGEWRSTLVHCASDDRFGSIRRCLLCDGADVKAGGAGSRYFSDELLEPCEAAS